MDEKIETWFQKWFHNQPGISDVTMVYNLLHDAKEDLKKTLATEGGKEDE